MVELRCGVNVSENADVIADVIVVGVHASVLEATQQDHKGARHNAEEGHPREHVAHHFDDHDVKHADRLVL